ncbi:hypothetical protein RvY_07228 [Ramazzottius varieornatus]|uniref:SP-RING-type domain-containing protein n=1 Tax=Ramazzottius varieornatus TaxID=947166 RepID=A0A1D1V6G0_RAMVA|nr:hypothetical protein RvY_07228 [Ramazzottius varieornatus]
MFEIPETFLQSHSAPNDTTCMLLRFCQNSGELPAPERHPRNLVLTLNYGQRLIEHLEHGDSSVEQTFKRFCSPVEVPKALLKSQNQLVIEWTDCFDIVDPAKDFLLFVEFAERQSQATILEEIQARKVEIGDTVAKLHSLLTPMNAPGVKEPIQPSMIFTLLCPMTKKRLTIPVRSRACQHNECFDAPAYLAANAASRSAWICPLCNKIALPEDLVLDEYVELLLRFSAMDKLEVVRDGSTVFVREIDPKRPPKLVPKAVEGAPLSSLSLTQLVPQYRTALSTNGTFVINFQQ